MDFIIISKDSMVANKLSYGVTVTPFLCRPLERDSEVEYRKSGRICDLAFLSDTLASGDYLTFWVKKRHEESTMKK